MKILVACEESQDVTIAFRNKGHEAYSCDIQECSGGHPEWHIKTDVLTILNNGWDMMIAHPDCTRLTNVGVRWLHNPPPGKTFDEMWNGLYEGVKFYKALRDADIPKKAIENPIMHKYARAMIGNIERQIVQPWWFGDKAFKATGFELYGLPERAKLRSKTFPGIAEAMSFQWSTP